MALTVYALKPRFITLLRPLAARIAACGGTANHITLAAVLFSLLYGLALALFPETPLLWFGLLPVLFLRMALNAIDGILAREFGQKSRLGGLLNELSDVVADAGLYLPFACVPGVSVIAVACFTWLALLTEYTGALGPLIGASRRYEGPMGKSDRAVVLCVLGVIVGIALPLGLSPALPVNIVLGLASGLMVLTTWNRMREALEETS